MRVHGLKEKAGYAAGHNADGNYDYYKADGAEGSGAQPAPPGSFKAAVLDVFSLEGFDSVSKLYAKALDMFAGRDYFFPGIFAAVASFLDSGACP